MSKRERRRGLAWQERERAVSRRAIEQKAEIKIDKVQKALHEAEEAASNLTMVSDAFALKMGEAKEAFETMGLQVQITQLQNELAQTKRLKDEITVMAGFMARQIRALTGEWPVFDQEAVRREDPKTTEIGISPYNLRIWIRHKEDPRPEAIFNWDGQKRGSGNIS